MASFWNELRPVTRRLIHSPMFTALTLITLAVGIGANTAIFSVLNGVLLKPLPYPSPDQLVAVWEKAPGLGPMDLNACPATYFTFREENHTFQDTGIWNNYTVSVTGSGEPEQVEVLAVTDGTLAILGIPPSRGSFFTQKDDQPSSPGTVILSYGYWQRKFGGDPSILGRRIIIDGNAHEVIGIMPQSFHFLDQRFSLLVPVQLDRSKTFIGNFNWQGLARLKPGVSLAQANADVGRMLPLMLRKFPPAPGMSLKMVEQARLGPNLHPLKKDVIGDIGSVLWVLMGTIGAVLLIACANVANLLLVRAEGRQHELAIRAALGAGKWQIARELLMESVTLGLLGGALGVGVAYAALRLLVVIGPEQLPRLNEVSIDPAVLLFTLAISLLAGILFGLIPVFKYAGPRLESALRQGGRTSSDGKERHRARSTLVVVQVSLALVLLVSSGLMIRTVRALKQVQPGFIQPGQVMTLRVSIPEAAVSKPDQVVRTYNDMVEKIAAVPGVASVSLSNSITMDGYSSNDPIFASDKVYADEKIPTLRRFKFVSPGTFSTMGNPLIAGRDFTWPDIYQHRQAVLVSENLARELWQTPAAALGKQVRENPKAPWREVIGVVGNARDNGVSEPAPTIVYWPMLIQKFWGQDDNVQRGMAFAIRSSRTGTASFLKEIQQAIWSVNPNLPIASVRTLSEIYDTSMARTSFTLVMLAIAAGMALLLGLVGIYGVISYSVSQRTREIGIRIALGAPQQNVRQMFVRQGLLLAGIGVVCGVAAAIALTRLMTALLFDVSPLDPATYCAVSGVLLAAALLASYFPARRATNIDPSEALRIE